MKLRDFRRLKGLTVVELSRIFKCASGTIDHWELGYSKLPFSVEFVCTAMLRGWAPLYSWEGRPRDWIARLCAASDIRRHQLALFLGVSERTAARYFAGHMLHGTPTHVLMAIEAWLIGGYDPTPDGAPTI